MSKLQLKVTVILNIQDAINKASLATSVFIIYKNINIAMITVIKSDFTTTLRMKALHSNNG